MHQATIDSLEPHPKSDYVIQRGQPERKVAQPSRSKKGSPVPSAREIDAAIRE
jgi:hypothetical protein